MKFILYTPYVHIIYKVLVCTRMTIKRILQCLETSNYFTFPVFIYGRVAFADYTESES